MNAAFRANTSCRQVLASRPRQTLNRGSAETKSLQSRRGNVSSKKLQKTFSLLPSLSRFVGARTRHLRRAHGVLGRHNTGWNGRWVTCSFSRSREYGDSDALGDGLEQVTEKIGGKPVTDLLRKERLFVLETNIDDLSPQVMAYAMEELLSAGGLDVWAVPILMKKGRPGTKINVLSEAKYVDTMIRIILTVRITGDALCLSFKARRCDDSMFFGVASHRLPHKPASHHAMFTP